MTPAEVDAYQARLRELLEERRQAAADHLMSLLAEGQPSQRKQAGL